MTRIYRTEFKIEVFSTGEWDDDAPDLAAINHAITDGDCIGNVELVNSTPVAERLVRAHLLRIGNDGTFFETAEDTA